MNALLDKMATKRATEVRLDREDERRQREHPPRPNWGSADGGRGSLPTPGAFWEPSGVNEFSPRGG